MTQLAEQLLRDAIEDQRTRMSGYEIPSEALTFETLRALDYAFCRELLPHRPALKEEEQLYHFILQRGVNGALSRVLPIGLTNTHPRLSRSTHRTGDKADQFLLDRVGHLRESRHLLLPEMPASGVLALE